MSYSVRNVRQVYVAKAQGSTSTTEDNKVTFGTDGNWQVYTDLEGCKYFECVENGHIVRTPKIERITYSKVTPGSDMNQKTLTYTVQITRTPKVGEVYTLNVVIPNFNGIDAGFTQSVRGTFVAKTINPNDVAAGIVADINDRMHEGTNDPNKESAFLWMQYLDTPTVSGATITFKTKVPKIESAWEAGADYMPEMQELKELKFECAPIYDGNVYIHDWATVKGPTTTTIADSYKEKLKAMYWFHNIDRGEINKDTEWMSPFPKAKIPTFDGEYSVLDLHYRVDGDGSIMGDVDVTIIAESSAAAKSAYDTAKTNYATAKADYDAAVEGGDADTIAAAETALNTAETALNTAKANLNDNANAILNAFKADANMYKSKDTFGM